MKVPSRGQIGRTDDPRLGAGPALMLCLRLCIRPRRGGDALAAPSESQPANAATVQQPKLPMLVVDSSPEQVVEKLETAARRGRMAGFERGTDGVLFKTAAFGTPFDGELEARAGVVPSGGTRLQFATRMKQKTLWIFIVILVVSIWPGAPITKSLLASMVPSWRWLWETTYWWYLPLSIVGSPWSVWSAVKKSRLGIAESAVEMLGKVEKELGATREPKAG